jgi:hypothetical protein
MFTYAFVVNIGIALNGVRMWTAAHFLLFGLLTYYLKEQKLKGFILICLTPLVHFSFFLPIIVFVFYLLLRIIFSVNWFYWFYLGTYFLEELDFEVGRRLVLLLPKIYAERSEGFVSQEKESLFLENTVQRPWYIELGNIGIKYGIFILISVLMYNVIIKKRKFDRTNWLGFSMFFLGIASLFSNLPSGSRYLIIAHLIVFPILLINQFDNRTDKLTKIATWFVIPGFLLYTSFSFRMMLEYSNYYLFVGNPFIAMFLHVEISVYELIESLF